MPRSSAKIKMMLGRAGEAARASAARNANTTMSRPTVRDRFMGKRNVVGACLQASVNWNEKDPTPASRLLQAGRLKFHPDGEGKHPRIFAEGAAREDHAGYRVDVELGRVDRA